jgi:hypothetical protein
MKSPRGSSSSVSQATRAARRLMPPDGDLMGLIENLAAQRARPIKVVDQPLEKFNMPSGITIALTDFDYIVVDDAAPPSRRTVILAHEIAHLMLEHDQGEHVSDDLIALAAPDLSPALIQRVLHRHGYAGRQEQDAEQMATALAAEHERRRRLFEIEGHPVSSRLR